MAPKVIQDLASKSLSSAHEAFEPFFLCDLGGPVSKKLPNKRASQSAIARESCTGESYADGALRILPGGLVMKMRNLFGAMHSCAILITPFIQVKQVCTWPRYTHSIPTPLLTALPFGKFAYGRLTHHDRRMLIFVSAD